MAMSGGIDSTVAAILLMEQGYELVGATFRTFDPDQCSDNDKGCCSEDAALEAQKMAATLGIPHHIVDFRQIFRDNVITNFVDEYMHGRTPNPCVICNSSIKWGMLLRVADELGCQFIATGHYARIVKKGEHYFLGTAADTHKDQTYFLWMLSEDNLARTIFPLGNYTKTQVRQMALEHGYEKLSKKSESQEICFIPDNDYRRFLSENVPDFDQKCCPGNFVNGEGKVVGQHEGFPFYTIGQRKGLRVAFGMPKYVTRIDAENNVVALGDRDDLLSANLVADNLKVTDMDSLVTNPVVQARIRYKSPATEARVEIQDGQLQLSFTNPVWGITPGQSVVLYQDDCVVGGGLIRG